MTSRRVCVSLAVAFLLCGIRGTALRSRPRLLRHLDPGPRSRRRRQADCRPSKRWAIVDTRRLAVLGVASRTRLVRRPQPGRAGWSTVGPCVLDLVAGVGWATCCVIVARGPVSGLLTVGAERWPLCVVERASRPGPTRDGPAAAARGGSALYAAGHGAAEPRPRDRSGLRPLASSAAGMSKSRQAAARVAAVPSCPWCQRGRRLA
jgi:hypothetical protein